MLAVLGEFARTLRDVSGVRSALAVTNPTSFSPVIDGFDLLLLVVGETPGGFPFLKHYSKDGFRIQERWSTPAELEHGLASGDNRKIVHWLLQGEILLDADGYLSRLRSKLTEFADDWRRRRLFSEFARFLESYLQAKQYIQEGHFLDAYSNILDALHHWARIVIIEEGKLPEITVWKQIRHLNPGVYKLYEELTISTESLEQRVRLVLLACEFSVMSKMESCCAMLLDLLRSREEAWHPAELRQHSALVGIRVDLDLVLGKLVRKGLIRQVALAEDDRFSALEIGYARI